MIDHSGRIFVIKVFEQGASVADITRWYRFRDKLDEIAIVDLFNEMNELAVGRTKRSFKEAAPDRELFKETAIAANTGSDHSLFTQYDPHR